MEDVGNARLYEQGNFHRVPCSAMTRRLMSVLQFHVLQLPEKYHTELMICYLASSMKKTIMFGVPAKWWPLSAVLLLSLLQWKCHACLISVKGCGSTHRGLAGYWLSWCQDFGIPFVWTEWLCKSKVERSSSFHQHCDISTHSSYWRYMTNFCL